MHDKIICGYLIRKRSGGYQPCMLPAMHKDKHHRDADYLAARRAYHRNYNYVRRDRNDGWAWSNGRLEV